MKKKHNAPALTYPAAPPRPVPLPDPKYLFGPERDEEKAGLWGAHDPAIYRDPATDTYYVYCTGAVARKSADLIRWETVGKVVDHPPKESWDHVGSPDIWAPDMIKVGDEYRLYCSNSTWGVRQSCIFLAVSDKAEGPFVPRGCVLKTTEESPTNAIDACLVEDHETGEQYMLYGSFWGGVRMIRLDRETGLAAEEGTGVCVARRPQWADCAIEGPYIRFNEDTGYYYLFVSYGSLKSDYNIRVGRSKCVTGPYFDYNGREMTDLDDFHNEVGTMIAAGYRFDGGQGWMGPGHNSVLRDDDGRWYLVCHIRPHEFKKPMISTMHVYQMLWTPEGWPVLVPATYAGERVQPVERGALVGHYERLKLTPQVPQGVLTTVPMELIEDGRLEFCSIRGRWEQVDETTVVLYYGPHTELCKIVPIWDEVHETGTLALTGMDHRGVCLWARKTDTVIPVMPTPYPPYYANHVVTD